MSINNNIWEIAEGYLAGTLPENDIIELKSRLESDTEFANEFYECTNLIRSFEGSGRQKRFRTLLRDIQAKQATTPARPKRIFFPAHIWRTAAVAASVAVIASAVTYSLFSPSTKKSESQYNTISREVEHIKRVQAQQQAEQNQMKENINKNIPAPPTADVKYTATGFALTNDGYFVTAYHVLNDGKGAFDSVYIQNQDGQYFKASLQAYNAETDVAIMKVEKKNFRFSKTGDVPYTFAKDKASLGEDIFTIGYPQDELVYSKGYISSKNGFDGNLMQYTLQLPAGHGQSGSPVIDNNGNIVGLLTAIGSKDETNTYAVASKAIIDLLHNNLPPDALHLPKANKMDKMTPQQRIEKMEVFTVSVKVYK